MFSYWIPGPKRSGAELALLVPHVFEASGPFVPVPDADPRGGEAAGHRYSLDHETAAVLAVGSDWGPLPCGVDGAACGVVKAKSEPIFAPNEPEYRFPTLLCKPRR